MKVLLLGGNGLLGHNVLYHLLQQGHEVHALLRRSSALRAESFPNVAENLTIFEGTLLENEALDKAAQGCEAIINCAGVTDMSLLHYEDYLPVNRDLCGRLIQLMQRQQISRLVHTSTANTIGFGTPQQAADEQSPMQPPFSRSFYALSKKEGEQLMDQAASKHPDWHIVIVNPGFMVGAYDTKPSSGALLLTGYRKPLMMAPSGGKSFIHVGDAAQAIVQALLRGENGGHYLLTGENLSLKEFYRLQAQVCGYRQWLIVMPDCLLQFAGRVGDFLRRCGIKTQVSTRNVRQLMVSEYYNCNRAQHDLLMPQTPIAQAIRDFFDYQRICKQ